MAIKVSQVNIYPLKSAAPVSLDQAVLTSRGLEHDRRWMVVDDGGQGLTAREFPALLRISPVVTGDGLRLSTGEMPDLEVRTPGKDAKKFRVRVFESGFTATLVSTSADKWLSGYLGIPCRLVYMRDEDEREVSESANGREGELVSCADQHPLLLTTQASLADLNGRLAEPVSMRNFRPNLVVAGTKAFAEDAWKSVRIGKNQFRVAQACTRCKLTTIDPLKARVREDKEPLKTLAKYRRNPDGHGVIFGVHIVPVTGPGTITAGDELEPIS